MTTIKLYGTQHDIRQWDRDDNITQLHVSILQRIFNVDIAFRSDFIRPTINYINKTMCTNKCFSLKYAGYPYMIYLVN